MKELFKQEPKDYGNKTVNVEYVLSKFDQLKKKKKIAILEKALTISIDNRVGSRDYAIARSMGYSYQDNGTYLKPGYYYPIQDEDK